MRVARDDAKVGRNEPCPCGSGKKYKKCCESADGSREVRLDAEDLALMRSLGEFAEPLTSLAEDDGQLRRAKAIALAAYGIALTRDLQRRERKMEELLEGLDDPRARENLRAIVEDMVERHYEMFPEMHKLTVDRAAGSGARKAGRSCRQGLPAGSAGGFCRRLRHSPE